MKTKSILTVLVLTLLVPWAVAQQEPVVDEAGRKFLDGLEGIDARVLATSRLAILLGDQRLGDFVFVIGQAEREGAPCYRLEARAGLEMGPVTSKMEGVGEVDALLRTLSSKSEELERQGDEEKTERNSIEPTADGYHCVKVKNGVEEAHDLPALEGLLLGPADNLACALLAVSGRRGTFRFVGANGGTLHPITLEVRDGEEEGTVVIVKTKPDYDDETDEPKLDDAGNPVLDKETTIHSAADGRVLELRLPGVPLRFIDPERIEEAPAGPEEAGESKPLDPVIAFWSFMARAEGSEEAFRRAVDWDSLWEVYLAGPGKDEMAGKSDEEVAATRQLFAGLMIQGMKGEDPIDDPGAIAFLTNRGVYQAQKLDDGRTRIRMTEELRESDENLANIEFFVAQGEDGRWRLVTLPGM